MFQKDRLTPKEFILYFTIYNIIAFILWIFPTLLHINFEISSIIQSTHHLQHFIFGQTFGYFIREWQAIWWVPITLYFNYQITQRRLADCGYSKWLSILNFYPLLFTITIIDYILNPSALTVFSIVFGVILPICKIGFILFLCLKPTKTKDIQND